MSRSTISVRKCEEDNGLQSENSALREALKPFADAADKTFSEDKDIFCIYNEDCSLYITIGNLRKARAVLVAGREVMDPHMFNGFKKLFIATFVLVLLAIPVEFWMIWHAAVWVVHHVRITP